MSGAIKGLIGPVLLMLVVAAVLWLGDGPPAADPVIGAAPPVMEDGPDGPRVRNVEAQQQLRIDGAASDGAIRVFPANALDTLTGDRTTVQLSDGELNARSPREFSLGPVRPDEYLVERVDVHGHVVAGFGAVRIPQNAFLGELVNTGWIAPAGDGGVVFAAALRPEVVRFNAGGTLRWTSERPLPGVIEPPVLIRQGSSVAPRFTEVQHGIGRGPDDRFYVLTGARDDSVRLDVLDADGVFQRTAWIPRGRDVLVDERGRVYVPPPEASQPGAASRTAFQSFDLPALEGGGRIRLVDHAGKVVVVNVWASWCAPCRQEMPLLDRLAATWDTAEVAVIGLNEDLNVDDARRFVNSIGGVGYPLARGDGKLRGRIGYRGLPYTAVLDRSHRIAKVIHGFGNDLDDLEHAIEAVLTEGRAEEQ